MEIKNLEKEFLKSTFPWMVLNLVKSGKFSQEDLKSPKKLYEIFVENMEDCVQNLEVSIGVSEEFVKWCQKALDEGDHHVAIVLIAVAFEQELNICYRFLFRRQGMSDDEISRIIKSHNIESKLTWLLKLAAQTELDSELKKKIKLIFDIRNAIIHYKGIPSRPDQDTGSFEKIELEIRNAEKMNMVEILNSFV